MPLFAYQLWELGSFTHENVILTDFETTGENMHICSQKHISVLHYIPSFTQSLITSAQQINSFCLCYQNILQKETKGMDEDRMR